jgi:dienelactone hydrolase
MTSPTWGDQRRAGDPSRFEYARVDVTVTNHGQRCPAWLYRPDRPAVPPLVVMAPGIIPDRRTVTPVARQYAVRGYAVLLFAPRHATDADGDPPGLLHPGRQAGDWAAAIDRAAESPDVDGTRPILRGRWLGGAAALAAAAERQVGAVVARSPLVDGRLLRGERPAKAFLGLFAAAVRDWLPGGDRTVPVATTDPETPALLYGSKAVDTLDDLLPEGAATRVPARSALALDGCRVDVAVDAPALLTASARDPLIPPGAVADTATDSPGATFVRHPADDLVGLAEPDRDPSLYHEFAFLADRL